MIVDSAVREAKLVVELGTGDGATASEMLKVMRPDAQLFCVNWTNPPSGDDPWRYLTPDPRLTLIFGDTRHVSDRIPDGIDLLIIDSTHTDECASEEWRLYEQKLSDTATVVVDDLDHNDMAAFWDRLRGDKEIVYGGRIGVLHYRRGDAQRVH